MEITLGKLRTSDLALQNCGGTPQEKGICLAFTAKVDTVAWVSGSASGL